MNDRPTESDAPPTVDLVVDGTAVTVPDPGISLLAALRGPLGNRAPKTGCNPQGQCGCCTVLVDGAPRVACVSPLKRMAGRSVTTVDGLTDDERADWADALLATGGSQCGACTPGIIQRLEGLRRKDPGAGRAAVHTALAAHLCRCTGWQTIVEAWDLVVGGGVADARARNDARDLDAAARRASIEGRSPQSVSRQVVLGRAGFSEDTAPREALVAVPDGAGGWVVAPTLPAARALAGKVQGRHGTAAVVPPLALPEGRWDLTLRTSWVEPAYLETDAAWCEPGGEASSPLANGGAFGGKTTSIVRAVARRLADEHGRCVRVVLSREDVVRMGPKRPPIAAGLRLDGTGVVRVVRTARIAEAITSVLPGVRVEEVDLPGPATSADIRAAGIAEAQVLRAALEARLATRDGAPLPRSATVRTAEGAAATVSFDDDGVIRVDLSCGSVLDETVLRSYAIGAVHMGLGWVVSEGLAVDPDGEVRDLTIRSFGVLRASEMPPVEVRLAAAEGEPVNGSDAVLAATAAAAWQSSGLPGHWPTGLPVPVQG